MMSIGSQNTFNTSTFGAAQFSQSNSSSNSLLNFPKSNTFNHLRTPSTARTSPIKASAAAAAEPVSYINPQSLYELLGISESGTLSDIKTAYRQLARKYHPDVSPPDRTEEYTIRFLEVQEAYETLSDPRTRACYDRDLARGLGLYSLFNGRNRSSNGNSGFVDREEWQSQLEELIRNSNIDEMNQTWGARMRSKRRSSN